MRMNLLIRELTCRDEAMLAEMLRSLSPETERFFHPYPFTAESAHRALCETEGLTLGALDDRGRLLGYGWYAPREARWPRAGLCVRDDAQGQGVGRALMEELLKIAQEAGKGGLKLEVVRENVRAQNLYESLGFVRTDEFWYERNGETVWSYRMEWRAR